MCIFHKYLIRLYVDILHMDTLIRGETHSHRRTVTVNRGVEQQTRVYRSIDYREFSDKMDLRVQGRGNPAPPQQPLAMTLPTTPSLEDYLADV